MNVLAKPVLNKPLCGARTNRGVLTQKVSIP
jgi:hypothetical protein